MTGVWNDGEGINAKERKGRKPEIMGWYRNVGSLTRLDRTSNV